MPSRPVFVAFVLTLAFFTSTLAATVVVIGAGAAGLAATKRLRDEGHTVDLIEAQARVGGRVRTVDFDGMVLDTGAMWLHDTRLEGGTNPLVGVAHADAATLTPAVEFSNEYRNSFGVDKTPYVNAHYPKFQRTMKTFYRRVQNSGKKDGPLFGGIRKAAKLAGVSNAFLPFVRIMAQEHFATEFSAPLTALSKWWFDEGAELPGDAFVPGGVFPLLQSYVGADVVSSARTRKVVDLIEYDYDQVEVHLKTGETLRADYVVVTVSLGVLKSDVITFANPPLSRRIRRAIARRGMGSVSKFYLRFNKMFWNPSYEGYYHYDAESVFPEVYNVNFWQPDALPTLVLFGGGALGPIDDAIALVVAQLRAMFPLAYGPDVVIENVFEERWKDNLFVRGSYSHFAVGSSPKDIKAFRAGHGPRVMFAGEHTSLDLPSSVQGALQSGVDAADAVLKSIARGCAAFNRRKGACGKFGGCKYVTRKRKCVKK